MSRPPAEDFLYPSWGLILLRK